MHVNKRIYTNAKIYLLGLFIHSFCNIYDGKYSVDIYLDFKQEISTIFYETFLGDCRRLVNDLSRLSSMYLTIATQGIFSIDES